MNISVKKICLVSIWFEIGKNCQSLLGGRPFTINNGISYDNP